MTAREHVRHDQSSERRADSAGATATTGRKKAPAKGADANDEELAGCEDAAARFLCSIPSPCSFHEAYTVKSVLQSVQMKPGPCSSVACIPTLRCAARWEWSDVKVRPQSNHSHCAVKAAWKAEALKWLGAMCSAQRRLASLDLPSEIRSQPGSRRLILRTSVLLA